MLKEIPLHVGDRVIYQGKKSEYKGLGPLTVIKYQRELCECCLDTLKLDEVGSWFDRQDFEIYIENVKGFESTEAKKLLTLGYRK